MEFFGNLFTARGEVVSQSSSLFSSLPSDVCFELPIFDGFYNDTFKIDRKTKYNGINFGAGVGYAFSKNTMATLEFSQVALDNPHDIAEISLGFTCDF